MHSVICPNVVREIAAGRRVIDPALAQKMAVQSLQGGEANPVEQLSEREFAVFIQLARGASVNRIDRLVSLSPFMVDTHLYLYNITQKLGWQIGRR